MRLDFAFGKTGLTLDLPDGPSYVNLEARAATPLDDTPAALKQALDSPIDCAPLVELARGASSAAISVCDITRPAPNRLTLPPLLDFLAAGGIPVKDTRILIATGLHRPATPSEIVEILGSDIAGRYPAFNHDARNRDEHRFLGATSTGTPVYIDERFVSADLRISLGFIEPHLMLGFSGGRKLVAPGLAAQETIKVLHSPRFMRDPLAVEGSVERNPLHRELLEISRMAGHQFILDVALAPGMASGARRIAGVFAGDPVAAHRKGVEFVAKTLLDGLQEPVDAVITSAAGYPLDLTFYQAIKGITAAQHIVKPGGRILIVAECAEGAGASEFAEMLTSFESYETFLETVSKREVIVDQWQLEKLAIAGQRHEILFYVPGLPAQYRKHFHKRMFDSAKEAVDRVTEGLKAGAKVALIPEGPYVLARVLETLAN
jgi:nickel-dependent lactate racemase